MDRPENSKPKYLTPTREEITTALERRAVDKSCPRCGHGEFTVFGETASISLGEIPGLSLFGDRNVPCAVTLCLKCGFVAMHALGTLGLLNVEESE